MATFIIGDPNQSDKSPNHYNVVCVLHDAWVDLRKRDVGPINTRQALQRLLSRAVQTGKASTRVQNRVGAWIDVKFNRD